MIEQCYYCPTKNLHLLGLESQTQQALITVKKEIQTPEHQELACQLIMRVAKDIRPKYSQLLFSESLLDRGSQILPNDVAFQSGIKKAAKVAGKHKICLRRHSDSAILKAASLDSEETKISTQEGSVGVRSRRPSIELIFRPIEVHYRTYSPVYDRPTELPLVVKRFSPREKHTIPLADYLANRISRPIQEYANSGIKFELFAGPSADVDSYYAVHGLEKKAIFYTPSSIQYGLFHSLMTGEERVVIVGISNQSKLTHTMLQLKALGVLEENIVVRGDIEVYKNTLKEALGQTLARYAGDRPVALAVIGNRSGAIIELANRLYPEAMNAPLGLGEDIDRRAEELLKVEHKHTLVDVDDAGIFKFSIVEVEIQGEKRVIIAFRMPNGDLAGTAAKALFEYCREVDAFVMVGAGGSLQEGSAVGQYQLTTSSILGDELVTIPQERVMEIPFRSSPICSNRDNRNVTVLSPLVETEAWYHEVKTGDVASVDVETFHIMKELSIRVEQGSPTQIFPGLFISDVVGEHPLVQKIDPQNAWANLPYLLSNTMEYIKVPDKRRLECC